MLCVVLVLEHIAMTDTKTAGVEAAQKLARTRSPNFPVIDLGAAVELTEKLFETADRHPLPIQSVIEKTWALRAGSYGYQIVAAVKAFGLIEVEGKGKKRQIKVSEVGAKIVRGYPEKVGLIAEAALAPRMFRSVWDKYGGNLPPDDTISYYLEFDHDPNFNRKSISDFLRQFRETIAFAKPISSAIIPNKDGKGEGDDDDDPKNDVPEPGDRIQWESGGNLNFEAPRLVTSVSEDKSHVFVEGNSTGIPVEEVKLIEKAGVMASNNPIPEIKTEDPSRPVMEESRWKLPSGAAVLLHPAKLTERDFKVLRGQIDLLEMSSLLETIKKPAD